MLDWLRAGVLGLRGEQVSPEISALGAASAVSLAALPLLLASAVAICVASVSTLQSGSATAVAAAPSAGVDADQPMSYACNKHCTSPASATMTMSPAYHVNGCQLF